MNDGPLSTDELLLLQTELSKAFEVDSERIQLRYMGVGPYSFLDCKIDEQDLAQKDALTYLRVFKDFMFKQRGPGSYHLFPDTIRKTDS